MAFQNNAPSVYKYMSRVYTPIRQIEVNTILQNMKDSIIKALVTVPTQKQALEYGASLTYNTRTQTYLCRESAPGQIEASTRGLSNAVILGIFHNHPDIGVDSILPTYEDLINMRSERKLVRQPRSYVFPTVELILGRVTQNRWRYLMFQNTMCCVQAGRETDVAQRIRELISPFRVGSALGYYTYDILPAFTDQSIAAEIGNIKVEGEDLVLSPLSDSGISFDNNLYRVPK